MVLRMGWDWQTPAAEFHRVPVRLGGVFEFLNTLDERTFGGRLPDDELEKWLAEHGEYSAAELVLAKELRRVLRAVTAANRTGELDDETSGELEELGGRLPLRVDTRLGLRGTGDGTAGALSTVLATVILSSADGSWARMKSCGAPDCGWVFYDHSKPRNARWCSTAGCGNRMKTRAYRERTS
ncbi:CGNR zinc finger domain-containing protein [Amycolatopsis sp. H20-H5]|uniref:CGNR zinc finger domain-containing protein n=1 Tax=Amycolatopsis sp. H20-H5 TaxID=3046309 RepID=UPI002DB7BF4E|nr:CGNR zinc finger domain-containing protein [Amycolatopsis sp. H20-H5]MEC3981919.1 CGNR zinc finger domain-containing protein [Amycolatopsis sp. H20-H5]